MASLLALLLLLSTPRFSILQDDRPQGEPPTGVTLHAEGSFDGYTLFSPLMSTTVYLIDMEGEVVHRWETEHYPGNSVYLLDDGHLLRCVRVEDNPGFHGGGIGGRVQELTWEGEVVWDYGLADEQRHSHHDIEPLPNGNVLFIVWERLTREEARALGRDPAATGEEGLWPDAVLEVRPRRPSGGEVVWEWHAKDHLIQDTDEALAGYGSIPDHPERIDINADHRDQPPMTRAEREEAARLEREMRALGYVGGEDDEDDDEPGAGGRDSRRRGGDWLHTNSVDYHAGLDLILLSTPRLNEVWILDHSTTTAEAAGSSGGRWKHGGDLLYRWGNPRTYGAGDDGDQQLFAQHDAQWIPAGSPGEGHVLVFNNGRGRPGGDASSVDELVLPIGREGGFVRAAGAAFGPEAPVWSHPRGEAQEFYASFISGCQRLPNGNTLICEGPIGRLFEVTAAGEMVWEYRNPFGERPEREHPEGGRPEGGRPEGGRPEGGRPAGERDGPPGGGPGRGGPPEGEPGGAGPRRGGGGPSPVALFRAERLAPDHPGLALLAR